MSLIEHEKALDKLISGLWKFKFQEKIIKYLRSYGFTFHEYDVIKTEYPSFKIEYRHRKYSFMIRSTKLPELKAQLDHRVFIGIKLNGKKVDQIKIYRNNKYVGLLSVPWEDSEDINFRKVEIFQTFPDELTYDERRKWRAEYKKVIRPGSTYKPSEFYLKWAPLVNTRERPKK